MIDLTENELSFLRRLKKHSVPLALEGNLNLLHIDRLVPEYVTRVNASRDTAVFTLKSCRFRANVGRHRPNHAFIGAPADHCEGGFRSVENSFGVGTGSGI